MEKRLTEKGIGISDLDPNDAGYLEALRMRNRLDSGLSMIVLLVYTRQMPELATQFLEQRNRILKTCFTKGVLESWQLEDLFGNLCRHIISKAAKFDTSGVNCDIAVVSMPPQEKAVYDVFSGMFDMYVADLTKVKLSSPLDRTPTNRPGIIGQEHDMALKQLKGLLSTRHKHQA
jgi:hypothetical protein